MEEILKQILDGQQEMRQEINLLRQELAKVNNRLDRVEQGQQEMRHDLQQQIDDLRDSTFIAFETLGKEIGAMRDTQAVAMDRWNKSMDIMERVEILLNEREAERVAVDATLVGHEERITILEQKVS